ncbi:hypothetical protein GJ496_011219 [Pomphorhynchus laevis]|nr:hypothetical protein GJ496_011219 [Pomphorhynchus laevis]
MEEIDKDVIKKTSTHRNADKDESDNKSQRSNDFRILSKNNDDDDDEHEVNTTTNSNKTFRLKTEVTTSVLSQRIAEITNKTSNDDSRDDSTQQVIDRRITDSSSRCSSSSTSLFSNFEEQLTNCPATNQSKDDDIQSDSIDNSKGNTLTEEAGDQIEVFNEQTSPNYLVEKRKSVNSIQEQHQDDYFDTCWKSPKQVKRSGITTEVDNNEDNSDGNDVAIKHDCQANGSSHDEFSLLSSLPHLHRITAASESSKGSSSCSCSSPSSSDHHHYCVPPSAALQCDVIRTSELIHRHRYQQCPHHHCLQHHQQQYHHHSCINAVCNKYLPPQQHSSTNTGKYPSLNIEPAYNYSNVMCLLKQPQPSSTSPMFSYESTTAAAAFHQLDKSDIIKRLYDEDGYSDNAASRCIEQYSSNTMQPTIEDDSIKSNYKTQSELSTGTGNQAAVDYENQQKSQQQHVERHQPQQHMLFNNGLNLYLRSSNWPSYAPVEAIVQHSASAYTSEQRNHPNHHYYTDLSCSSSSHHDITPSSWSSTPGTYNNNILNDSQAKTFLAARVNTDMRTIEGESTVTNDSSVNITKCNTISATECKKPIGNTNSYNAGIDHSAGFIHCPASKCSFHEDILLLDTSINPSSFNSCELLSRSAAADCDSPISQKQDMLRNCPASSKEDSTCKVSDVKQPNKSTEFQLQQALRRSHQSIQHKKPHVLTSVNVSDIELSRVERKRQRNRIAARKCRTKKLERIAELEAKVKELSAQNKELENEAIQLKLQFYQLREILIDHYKSGRCELQEGKDICRSSLSQLALSGH